MGFMGLIFFITSFAVSIIGCILIAQKKNHNVGLAALVGALTGVLGLLYYIFLPTSEDGQKKCSNCAELIKIEAKVCKHCGSKIEEFI